MPSTQENLSGRQYGQIDIGDIAGNNPLKYKMRCTRCRSEWVATHSSVRGELQSSAGVTCKNDSCRLGTGRQQDREKDYFRDMRKREQAEREAQTDRALRNKYGKPVDPPAPKPSLDDIEAQFKRTASELARAERDRIVQGLPDPSFIPDPRYDKAKMPTDKVDSWNNEQAEIFMARNPSYYRSEENSNTLLGYIWNQGVRIISAETLQRAYERLKQFNLLDEGPPEIEPVEGPPDPLPSHHEGYYEPKPKPQQRWDGIDIETGEDRSYSDYEVRRMTSDELRRKLKIPTAAQVRYERAA